MEVNLYIWQDESSPLPRPVRKVPFALARAYGINAGYYKVQAVQPGTGIVLTEWKQPLL